MKEATAELKSALREAKTSFVETIRLIKAAKKSKDPEAAKKVKVAELEKSAEEIRYQMEEIRYQLADYFVMTVWNRKMVEGELHANGRKIAEQRNERVPDQLLRKHNTKKGQKKIWDWFVKRGKPEDVLEEKLSEMYKRMKKPDSPGEQKVFAFIVERFKELKPRKLSRKKLMSSLNLFRGILALWAGGKHIEAIAQDERLLNDAHPKKKPRNRRLARYARLLMDNHNNKAIELQKEYPTKKKRDEAPAYLKDSLRQISFREAVRRANKQTKMFSDEEVDRVGVDGVYEAIRKPSTRAGRRSGRRVP